MIHVAIIEAITHVVPFQRKQDLQAKYHGKAIPILFKFLSIEANPIITDGSISHSCLILLPNSLVSSVSGVPHLPPKNILYPSLLFLSLPLHLPPIQFISFPDFITKVTYNRFLVHLREGLSKVVEEEVGDLGALDESG